jgi:hypothetical protein
MARKGDRLYPRVRCPHCNGSARRVEDIAEYASYPTHGRGYVCDDREECRWWIDEHRDLSDLVPDDGRIREPEDALTRLTDALVAASRDGRLSELDRLVHAVYCDRATELGWVEVMAGDAWVCERLGLDAAAGHRTRVMRARKRLAALGYVKEMKEAQVTHRGLKAQVAARRSEGKRPVTLIEIQKAPGYPTCDHCGGEIPDVQRVSARYCSPRCRQASGRVPPELEAALSAALGLSR